LAAPLKTDDCEADGVKVTTVALLPVVVAAAVDVVLRREALVVGTLTTEAGVDEAAATELADAVGVSETRELVRLYAAAQLTRDIPCGCCQRAAMVYRT
jgi:hypothetical protein